jgi:hypothetical protein
MEKKMTEEVEVNNNASVDTPELEPINGVPVVLDLKTADDITIKNMQLTLIDAYEKSKESEHDKERFEKLNDAVLGFFEYLLPEDGYEQMAFDIENMLTELDNELETNGETSET